MLICAPHTSNWDGLLLVLASFTLRMRPRWFLKHTWFRGPFAPIVRFTGAFPIDRRAPKGVVAQVVDAFAEGGPLIVAVAPEGTRRRVEHWKMGFLHIARGAGVPLVMGYVDYGRKTAGLGPTLVPSGDLAADFAALRAFYETITPRRPDLYGPIVPAPEKPARPV